ncbi:MAG TPA: exosortase/archaeosortase family protein [Candidatus Acidoferrum sp.]|nr:exosortase/archaeosortase family protein [Candidatus Acidoferrum sp.]
MARHEQNENALQDAVAAAEASALSNTNTAVTRRWLLFAGWIVLSSLLFTGPLVTFVRTSLSNDDASYLVLIPFISAWVLFVERHKIFLHLSYDKVFGGRFLFLAGCAALASRLAGGAASLGLQLSGYILSLVLLWVAGFALLFGKAASKAGYFPLLFLFLMVPLPNFLLDHVIYLLQAGSAWITGAFFDLLGVPALRDGLVFHLARVNIEVAKECSGIRSSVALLILALLVVHFRLKSFWNKTLFVACGLFVMILKNGIRIATLTLLAVYADPSFLSGRLHHEGGIVFFVLGLLLLLPVLLFLQRRESRRPVDAEPSQTSQRSIF